MLLLLATRLESFQGIFNTIDPLLITPFGMLLHLIDNLLRQCVRRLMQDTLVDKPCIHQELQITKHGLLARLGYPVTMGDKFSC